MIKASALYIVIIIALVIGLLCSSLIVCAYFYREQYQRSLRYDHLQTNVSSGVNILLADQDADYLKEKSVSLFGGDADSVLLQKIPWGVYDIGISKAFVQQDTLYKVFSIANVIDSTRWAALYLVEEDRPVSVSGKTMIRGEAYISKAGVKEAYVDGKSYQGDKRLIIGKTHNSDKKLPALLSARLSQLEQRLNQVDKVDSNLLAHDTVNNSFMSLIRTGSFGKKTMTLTNVALNGNVILFSDTTITIDKSASLNNVIVFAKSIIIKSGFRGTCQLYALDSIHIEHDCVFSYPSAIGIVRFKPSAMKVAEKITLESNVNFSGLIFTYEQSGSDNLRPLIDLGKNDLIAGQVYSQGIVGLKDGVAINGSIYTSRFLYQSSFTRFENYIINTTIDAAALSPYYLSSDLLPAAGKKRKVLQWLETK